MEKEDRDLLERAVKLGEENNKILRSMRRSGRIALFFQVAYWVIIIVLSFGAFYFIQPYITAISGGATKAQSSFDSFKSLMEQYGGN